MVSSRAEEGEAVLRIVATSDWHVGARLGSAGRAARTFREARFETARRIVDLANAEGAPALFLLGDTFDSDQVGLADLRRTLDVLARAHGEALVLPGNHDWWHAGGVVEAFAREVEKEGRKNVRVLAEATPLSLQAVPGVTFFPCSVTKHADVADPTAWIPARRAEDGLRVGLAHGTLDLADWGGRVPARVAEVRDLDLMLLGDWHGPSDGPDGRTHYPGSPEPGGFDEPHVGQVIVAELDSRSRVRRVPVGSLSWRKVEVTLESDRIGGAGVRTLREALAAIDMPRDKTALLLRLHGRLSLPEQDELDALLASVPDEGWAECRVENDVSMEGEPALEVFEEQSLRTVAGKVWESEVDEVVRRRALAILQETLERMR